MAVSTPFPRFGDENPDDLIPAEADMAVHIERLARENDDLRRMNRGLVNRAWNLHRALRRQARQYHKLATIAASTWSLWCPRSQREEAGRARDAAAGRYQRLRDRGD